MAQKSVIYLDHAAATPLDPDVLAAMQPYLTGKFYNPSAQYDAARSVKADLDSARSIVAHWLGARSSEVVFTAGGTEANNLVIHGVMQQYPDANIVVSAVEHDSVLNPAQEYDHKIAKVLPDGRVDVEALKDLVDDKTILVSIQYANNEVGTVQPIRRTAEVVAEIRKLRQKQGNNLPIYLHTDACQAPLYLDIHTATLGVDFMTINSSKMYGPKQTGALFVKAGTVLKSTIQGGGQEKGLRSGTENVANIIGFATALEAAQTGRHKEVTRLQKLQTQFLGLLEENLPQVIVNGSKKYRLPNNIHVTFPGIDNERLMMQLDNEGVICAAGSACSASNEEPSHVLKAMGLNDEEAQSSLRFTMGRSITEADVQRVINLLCNLAN